MRKTFSQDYPQHTIAHFDLPVGKCRLELASTLSTTATWREVHGSVTYVLTVENFSIDTCSESRLADITVLHTRDAYFTVKVSVGLRDFFVKIMFHGMAWFSGCSAPVFAVKVYNQTPANNLRIYSYEEPCDCNRDKDLRIHSHRKYFAHIGDLEDWGVLIDDKINFEIELCRQ